MDYQRRKKVIKMKLSKKNKTKLIDPYYLFFF